MKTVEQTETFRKILKRYWGYHQFRPLQEEIILAIASGKDTLGLLPTGGGKSVTFQVPVMAMKGICLVITPLIALMQDQVENLRKIGISATTVHSGMPFKEIAARLNGCISGRYKFLYLSPERLHTPLFQKKIEQMQVCLLVVDESHCISQWGYDFRPAYLRIAEIRKVLPGVPVLALTATATSEVVEDIQKKLLFKKKNVLRAGFGRPNLAYIVRKTENKFQAIENILRQTPGSAIIYVRNRKLTLETALFLNEAGFSAEYFHAGLSREEKQKRYIRWKKNSSRIMVATNAFGMGIDKPDVRIVIHPELPGTIEEYFQEAGRAGRDGEKAYAVILYSNSDKTILQKHIADEFPDRKIINQVYKALGEFLAKHFPEETEKLSDFTLAEFCACCNMPSLQVHYSLKLLELAGYIVYKEEQEGLFGTDNVSVEYIHKAEKIEIPAAIYEKRKKRKKRAFEKLIHYTEEEHRCRSRMLLTYLDEKEPSDCGICDFCMAEKKSGRKMSISKQSETVCFIKPKQTRNRYANSYIRYLILRRKC